MTCTMFVLSSKLRTADTKKNFLTFLTDLVKTASVEVYILYEISSSKKFTFSLLKVKHYIFKIIFILK